jgi:TolA-binding protein
VKDPKRLRETHADQLEGLLLDAVRAEGPSASARAQTLRAVAAGIAVGGTVATTAGTASSAAGPTAKASVLVVAGKWLAVGAGAGAIVAGAIVGPLHHLMAPSTGASSELSAPAPAIVPGKTAPAPRADVTDPSAEEVASPMVEARDDSSAKSQKGDALLARPASRAPDVQRARPSAAAPLAAEVAAVDHAAHAVANRDSQRALAALDAYQKQFPSGVLRPEATVLRVQALVQQGDFVRAVSIARAFLAQNPHSPHAERLRSLIEVDSRVVP